MKREKLDALIIFLVSLATLLLLSGLGGCASTAVPAPSSVADWCSGNRECLARYDAGVCTTDAECVAFFGGAY